MIAPLVSVIIPNYNHQLYLKKRIDSVLNQSFTNFELILLDDCSPDNSREILESYRDNPFVSHIVLNEQNSGSTFKQWRKGLQLSAGKYIWIAESDDFADVNFLLRTVSLLENRPNSVIAFTGSEMVDEDGCSIDLDWDKYSNNTPLFSTFASGDFLQKQMLWKNGIYNASMVVFKKECFFAASSKYVDFKYCGDWLFWVEIARQGDVIRINEKLNFFRQHSNKVSPAAEKEGLYFLEGYAVIDYVSSLLSLSSYQRSVVMGRVVKRLYKASKQNVKLPNRVYDLYPQLAIKRFRSLFIYSFDRVFNISKLH